MKKLVTEIIETISKTLKENGCNICSSKEDLQWDLESGIVSCGRCTYLELLKKYGVNER